MDAAMQVFAQKGSSGHQQDIAQARDHAGLDLPLFYEQGGFAQSRA